MIYVCFQTQLSLIKSDFHTTGQRLAVPETTNCNNTAENGNNWSKLFKLEMSQSNLMSYELLLMPDNKCKLLGHLDELITGGSS